jgi:UDP-3-O-acyl-N-acetylglucosamine deacetylase
LAHALQSNTVREVLSSSVTYHTVSIQTLTTLNIYGNKIGDEGARHLGHALQNNAVREVLSLSITYQLLCFNTDTHHSEAYAERYR